MTTLASPLPAPPATAEDLAAITTAQWRAVLAAAPADAAGWITAAAQLGHAEAQAVLGQWQLDGHGVAPDPAQALHWFLRAAQRGHAMAMNMAGRCHEQGWGTQPDAGKAAHWYRQALRLGLPEAHYNLANLLAAGSGVACDHDQAFALYEQAAGQGYAKAFAKLGRYFEDGQVVARDADEALRCYRRGAEGGDFRGQFCYAGMLAAQGREAEALHWLAKVPETATPRYLKQAGALLLESTHAAFRAIGERMLARAEA
ncbi:MAG TPA: tetratricopeptide repeat protein [Burkholderiaceae bacterium]|nr:tetratricopeptide repeat protein [Burkholderiaceae bacterium]